MHHHKRLLIAMLLSFIIVLCIQGYMINKQHKQVTILATSLQDIWTAIKLNQTNTNDLTRQVYNLDLHCSKIESMIPVPTMIITLPEDTEYVD